MSKTLRPFKSDRCAVRMLTLAEELVWDAYQLLQEGDELQSLVLEAAGMLAQARDKLRARVQEQEGEDE